MAIAVNWGVSQQTKQTYLRVHLLCPNIGKVKGAYYFGLVRPSVLTHLKWGFEISQMDSLSKNN